ncbi:MAG: Elongation factor Ts [Parcubacteria group bacterium GW2011_GWF2_44_7]|nr:MAG: Elongation factor Ts [Parcubacteria group bacterium GW2011_GWF2_44_7]
MIPANLVKELREKTGASMMECKKALEETGGDEIKAIEALRKRGTQIAAKKSERVIKAGLIEAYIHSNKRVGVLLELGCETDFVARNEAFQNLAHDIAMHIAAMNPRYLNAEDLEPEFVAKEKQIYLEQYKDSGKPANVIEQIIEGKIQKLGQEVCLLEQAFIKEPDKKIKDLIQEAVAKIGENIKIGRFTRYEI